MIRARLDRASRASYYGSMTLAGSQEAVTGDSGSSLRPEGEKASGHASEAGEVSPRTLANQEPKGSNLTAPVTPSLEPASEDEYEIVRATARIPFDLADLAEDRKAHIGRKCGGLDVCTACRTLHGLRDVRASVVRAMNAAMRLHVRVDADAVDRIALAEHRSPNADEWVVDPGSIGAWLRTVLPGVARAEAEVLTQKIVDSKGRLYTYPLVRRLEPSLSGSIAATIQNQIQNKWRQMRYDVLVRQSKSAPHYRISNPIPVPGATVRVAKIDSARFSVAFSLRANDSGRTGHEFKIAARPRERIAAVLSAIVDGTAKIGALSIEEDRRRPGRWYMRLAYKRKVSRVVPNARAAAINRGIVCFLAAVTSEGEDWLYDGDDIEAYLKQVQRRRRRYQYQLKASMRGGHGRKRTIRPIEHLSGKVERWRETRNQTIARRLADWFREREITRVFLENFEGIRDGAPEKLEGGQWSWQRVQEWPYYQLQMRLISCLEEYGIGVEVVPAAFISQTCPVCKHVAKENMNLRSRRLICEGCGWSRHLDIAAAMNVLDRGLDGERSGDQKDGSRKSLKFFGARKRPRRGARKASRKSLKTEENGGASGDG